MKNIIGTIALSLMAVGGPALAQSYPEKSVTLVVPYGPGGASDLAGRALAETAQPFLEQPVTVMNKPGAGGMNGARLYAAARPGWHGTVASRDTGCCGAVGRLYIRQRARSDADDLGRARRCTL